MQFDKNEVRQFLESEKRYSSYEWIGMKKVKYKIEATDPEFHELSFQLSQNFLLETIKTRTDIQLEPSHKLWPMSLFIQKVMEYCAIHKDPCFSDEREFRIYAYPSAKADARIFTGLAARKEIKRAPNGKSYIEIGEHFRPGIIPRKIIIGTKANHNITSILENYNNIPEIEFSNLPIA